MKKIACLLIGISLLFFSCEDVVSIDVPTSEPKLVIDARLGVILNNGNPISSGEIILSLGAPFYTEENPIVSDADVRIIDESTGTSYTITQSKPGEYKNGFPEIKPNTDYTLEIFYNNEMYTATEQLVRTGIIDNVEQGDGYLLDEEEIELIITFSDIPNQEDYYLFAFDLNNFLISEDEFYQDGQLTFSYFYSNSNLGDVIAISLYGVNKRFANYTTQILTQSGEDGSAGLGVPPSNVRGNIINSTNSDNFPLGYFSISEIDIALLEVN